MSPVDRLRIAAEKFSRERDEGTLLRSEWADTWTELRAAGVTDEQLRTELAPIAPAEWWADVGLMLGESISDEVDNEPEAWANRTIFALSKRPFVADSEAQLLRSQLVAALAASPSAEMLIGEFDRVLTSARARRAPSV